MVTPTVQYLFLSKQRLVIQRLDSMVENAHGEVKTPIEEPRFELRRLAYEQVYTNLGRLLRELSDRCGKTAFRIGNHYVVETEAKLSLKDCCALTDRVAKILQGRKKLLHGVEYDLSVLCQPEATLASLTQSHTQALFESRHVGADG